MGAMELEGSEKVQEQERIAGTRTRCVTAGCAGTMQVSVLSALKF